ncbi:TPA: hypothetical protein DCL28_00305 [Candidatus Komeilibacteria bacterium]|nr:hypothetical protein [Candidatus Komeilibacteria bacterium]HBV02555.1 hypothetical protein [Candidatus Komeilibacteria bacterium]HCC73752.1 hypothetical protein [Candidatus Komeilibacteria bacterium]
MTFLPTAILTLFFLLLPFFLMFLLFRWGWPGLIIFLVLTVVGLLLLIRLAVVWYYNAFLITNQRVILYKQHGLFDRQVMETEYHKIQDVSFYFKGLWQALFHYGSLKIQVLSSETVIIMEKIARPQKIQEIVKTIQNNKSKDNDELSEEELTLLAKKLKARLDPQKLRRLLEG